MAATGGWGSRLEKGQVGILIVVPPPLSVPEIPLQSSGLDEGFALSG